MAQWSARQTPTAFALIQVPVGQSIHTNISIILWASSKRPMMREVECLIRLYEVWMGLGVMSVGGRVSMACSKVYWRQAGVRPNTFGGRNDGFENWNSNSIIETAILLLKLRFENWNSDSTIETVILLLKLGFGNWNSDSNIEIAILLLKLGFGNWNSDSNIEIAILSLKLGLTPLGFRTFPIGNGDRIIVRSIRITSS